MKKLFKSLIATPANIVMLILSLLAFAPFLLVSIYTFIMYSSLALNTKIESMAGTEPALFAFVYFPVVLLVLTIFLIRLIVVIVKFKKLKADLVIFFLVSLFLIVSSVAFLILTILTSSY